MSESRTTQTKRITMRNGSSAMQRNSANFADVRIEDEGTGGNTVTLRLRMKTDK